MSFIIENVNINFHQGESKYDNIVPKLFEVEEKKFGTMNILMKEIELSKIPWFIFFSNDISGSMSSLCENNKNSKMEHSNHTIRNILTLFSKYSNDVEIWVQVDAFDDQIDKIIPAQRVTEDNIDFLLSSVNKMRPRNSTNIELAMNNANGVITKFQEENENFNVAHIFTTDGNATVGIQNIKSLSELVNKSFVNIFIGFGLDHSMETLNSLANYVGGRYYFIDDIENGGLVYGEILHSLLYKCFENIKIDIQNGEIYDYMKGTWESTLHIDSLYSHANKTFHINSSDPNLIEISLTGTNNNSESKGVDISFIVDIEEDKECIDLSKYIFKQKLQELMFKYSNKNYISVIQSFKNLYENLEVYMEDYKDDEFLIKLHDDIVVIISSSNTMYGEMFCNALKHSNAKEQVYNVRNVPKMGFMDFEDLDAFGVSRGGGGGPTMGHQQYRTFSDDNCNRQYSTPIQMAMMRGCSAPMPNSKVSDNIFNFKNVNDSQNEVDDENEVDSENVNGSDPLDATPRSYRSYAAPRHGY
jgi:hypothetical protein